MLIGVTAACDSKDCSMQIALIKHAKEKEKEQKRAEKKAKKEKEKTVAVLIEEAAALVQRLVRIKDADEHGNATCKTCGKKDSWKKMQGGHFISRVHLATKLIEENIHPQCVYCNQFRAKDGLMLANYYDYMVEMYGKDFVNDLRKQAAIPKKYKRAEILEIKAGFEKQLAELEKRLS